MDNQQLYQDIETLPENLKEEVKDFVDFLKHKAEKIAEPKKQRVYGYAKGAFKMADDFDEPLEDFKDYM